MAGQIGEITINGHIVRKMCDGWRKFFTVDYPKKGWKLFEKHEIADLLVAIQDPPPPNDDIIMGTIAINDSQTLSLYSSSEGEYFKVKKPINGRDIFEIYESEYLFRELLK